MFDGILQTISQSVEDDSFWKERLAQTKSKNPVGIHLAILVEPYLEFILEGKKTVESRFSVNRCAPYNQIFTDDIILLKKSGGPIVGISSVKDVWYYRLDPKSWKSIRKEFTQVLCAQDPEFWHKRQHTSYATLIRLKNPRTINPVNINKRDRRGWVVLKKREAQMVLM